MTVHSRAFKETDRDEYCEANIKAYLRKFLNDGQLIAKVQCVVRDTMPLLDGWTHLEIAKAVLSEIKKEAEI